VSYDHLPNLEVIVTKSAVVIYAVEMTEYERGWGSRPDGFLAFATQAEAEDYVHNAIKDRTGHAPDVYVAYSLAGYQECTHAFFEKLILDPSKNFVYFDRLTDLRA
jgi:hypothetical protein